ncbi:hypothetical protein [Acetobacter orientalis]|uniref:Uncharacterized protein n=1 Tax=Acetobacter orientalis TaxID=146474 RepID=A0A0D6NIV8_9PROT|nr:hypothetical protein [Acetobacter orientalis]GAN65979.1 hypothetical protein Abor_014_144 [Acetobacter orientalis]GBR17483.1 hypothetical protein AA0481_1373 [Acetobacter orientalis NRIC 0481]GEL60347.1 hypothetical protein AOR02nite_01890 [Acetobacter orientalis]
MSFTKMTVSGDATEASLAIVLDVKRDVVINATAGIIIDLMSRDRLTYSHDRLTWPSGAYLYLDASSRTEIETEMKKGRVMSDMIMTGRQFYEEVRQREAEAQARRDAEKIALSAE